MSEFKNAQVTLKGNVLLAKALMGEALTFTKIVLGDGYSNKPIMEMQDLVSVKKELPITKLRRKEQVAIIGSILKMGEIEPFYWRELGLYARGEDGVEVLYMYGNAADLASYISSNGLNEKLIDINVVIGNASNVSAVIDSSLVFLTQQDLVDHNNDEDAHQALKIWVLSLFNNGDWAKYSQAEDIQNRMGKNTDDETKSTLFGGLASLKSKILSYLDTTVSYRAPANTALSNATWTNARATAIDTINTNAARLTAARATIIDNIGATNNTGGSATTGTVMAKLNAILTWFTGTWTATRAGLIDTINNNTKANNTASSTGTLSQKLSYLISTLIGATGATGGTTTAGTVMAKLNTLLGKVGQGDFCGKSYAFEQVSGTGTSTELITLKSYTNTKGGIIKFSAYIGSISVTPRSGYITLVVDGVTVASDVNGDDFGSKGCVDKLGASFIEVPFKKSFEIKIRYQASSVAGTYKAVANIHYYLNT